MKSDWETIQDLEKRALTDEDAEHLLNLINGITCEIDKVFVVRLLLEFSEGSEAFFVAHEPQTFNGRGLDLPATIGKTTGNVLDDIVVFRATQGDNRSGPDPVVIVHNQDARLQ